MSERKVLNKYYPPDFDPSKIVKVKGVGGPGQGQKTVRLMTPFSMRCNRCGEYIYKGKKFNARKETVQGESYLSIKIFRFYIKCTRCSAEITFKTDPKNADYVAEHGASRNFEPWRDKNQEESSKGNEYNDVDEDSTQIEELNPMKALENRTMDSKREMEILDALDEIRTRNARTERVDAQEVLEKIASMPDSIDEMRRREDEEIEQLAKAAFKTADGESVRRVVDSDDIIPTISEKTLKFTTIKPKKRKQPVSSLLGVVLKKPKG